MTAHSFLIIVLTVLVLLCITAVIFVERKNPASTIAWTLVLIFFPVIGFIAYLMFGSGFHVSKKKRYALKRISDTIYRQILSGYIDNCGKCLPDEGSPHARLIRYLENDAEYYSGDNNATIFTHGEALFEAMKADLRAAKTHIHLLYYIFRNDDLGREILAILTEKAKSGVAVRIIYDSLGSLLSGERMFRELREAGGEVEAFSPLMFTFSSHLRLNYRNHRKITVIDGVIGYVGGMNIGVEYLGRSRLRPWRDTHLRLVGTAVSFLQERFLMDWMSVIGREFPSEAMQALLPTPRHGGGLGVQIVSSGPDMPSNAIKSGMLELLYTARKNVFIQTPYFAPDEGLLDALRIAAHAGVDVRLMLPRLIDHFFVHGATYSYAQLALQAGVRIFRYNGFLHAKTLVVDGAAATIGTANFDNRSFSLNFEINAFIYDAAFASDCERIFLQDQEHCDELTEDWFRKRNPFVKASYSVCRLFAPLI